MSFTAYWLKDQLEERARRIIRELCQYRTVESSNYVITDSKAISNYSRIEQANNVKGELLNFAIA